MFLAFDAPVPFSTMGRRNVSNVPAQALTLLNDPLVIQPGRPLGRARCSHGPAPIGPRSESTGSIETAFGRPPTDREAARLPGVPRRAGRAADREPDRPARPGPTSAMC